jgi:membrane protein DedA with SNARE-associated domain
MAYQNSPFHTRSGGKTKEDGAMKLSLKTYTAYSIGCAVVWAVILTVVATKAGQVKVHTFLLLFLGWVIGWLSATIARSVYPPPKRWRPVEKAP